MRSFSSLLIRIIIAPIILIIFPAKTFLPYLPAKRLLFLIPIAMKLLNIWKLAALSLMRTWNKRAHRQPMDSPVTVVLTQYQVKTSCRHQFLEALSEYIFSSGRATGNIQAEAYYEKGDAGILWTIERWRNRTFYKTNRKTDAAKVVSALIKTGLASSVETMLLKELAFLSKEGAGDPPKTHEQPITVMLLVDVKTGTANHFRSINQALLSAFRNEPGILVFQLSQATYHKNRFIVFKKFRNWDAFKYHLTDPALEPVMQFLQASIKRPPFEKGYHHLIQLAPL